jgi:hypothetical protein
MREAEKVERLRVAEAPSASICNPAIISASSKYFAALALSPLAAANRPSSAARNASASSTRALFSKSCSVMHGNAAGRQALRPIGDFRAVRGEHRADQAGLFVGQPR